MTALALTGTILLAAPAPSARAEPPRDPRIVGGGPADPGEYPFMTAILNESRAGDDYQKQFCGGSLVDANWVLTAAHCVDSISAGSLAVVVGRTILTSSAGQRRSVEAIYVHPDWDPTTGLDHDVALLELASRVNGIEPIELAAVGDERFEVDGAPLTVIGWGNTSGKGRAAYPDGLREGQVDAVSDPTCGQVYGASFDAPTMVCAAAPGVDSCQGDSGGPLFAVDQGVRIQVGTVSWGNGCARKRFPGVYGEVNSPAVASWIVSTISI